MNYPTLIPIALGAVLLVFYLIEKCQRYSYKGLVLKMTVSFCFIALGIICMLRRPGLYASLLFCGLVCGLIGDFVLDLKDLATKHKDPLMRSGFAVFGLGHLFYMAAMYLSFGRFLPFWWTAGIIIVGVLIGMVTAASGKLFGNDYTGYTGTVSAYCSVLAMDLVMAVVYLIKFGLGEPGLLFMSVGLALFVISDLVLSCTYFGKNHEKPADFIANYLSYFPAQYIIALSVLFV